MVGVILAGVFGAALAVMAGMWEYRRNRAFEDAAVKEGALLRRLSSGYFVAYNCAMFLAMLAGVAAKYFWEHGFEAQLDTNALWRPMLVTPIIFLPVYVAAAKSPRGLVPILVAFQNGFFWQTVIESSSPA
jgi:ABC-type Na+ efflux pump permease subunit